VTLINDFEGSEPRPGQMRRLRITEAHDYDLVGTLLAAGDAETRRHGDTETRRRGDAETRGILGGAAELIQIGGAPV